MVDRLYVLLDSDLIASEGDVFCPTFYVYNEELMKTVREDTKGFAFCETTYIDTMEAIMGTNKVVFTSQLDFLSFKYAKRLFVLHNSRIHEITLGKCEGTKREIKVGHNLKNLLLAGEFDWFNSSVNFQKACEMCFKFMAHLEGVRQLDYFEFCFNNGICIKDVEKYVNEHYEEF